VSRLIPLKGGRIDTPARRLVTKGAANAGSMAFVRVDVYGPGEPVGATPRATVHVPRKTGQRWFREDRLLLAVLAALTDPEEE